MKFSFWFQTEQIFFSQQWRPPDTLWFCYWAILSPILSIANVYSKLNFVSPRIQSDDKENSAYFLMVSVTHSRVFNFFTPFGQCETATALNMVHATALKIHLGCKGHKRTTFSEGVVERKPNPVWKCSFWERSSFFFATYRKAEFHKISQIKPCRDKYSIFTWLASAAQGTNQWDVGTAAGQKVLETSKSFLLLPSMLEKGGNLPAERKQRRKGTVYPSSCFFGLLFSPLVNSSRCTLVEDFPSLFSHLGAYIRSLGRLGWKMDFVIPPNSSIPSASTLFVGYLIYKEGNAHNIYPVSRSISDSSPGSSASDSFSV